MVVAGEVGQILTLAAPVKKHGRFEFFADVHVVFRHEWIGKRPIHGMQFLGIRGLFAQRTLGHRDGKDHEGLLKVAGVAIEGVFAQFEPLGAEIVVEFVDAES